MPTTQRENTSISLISEIYPLKVSPHSACILPSAARFWPMTKVPVTMPQGLLPHTPITQIAYLIFPWRGLTGHKGIQQLTSTGKGKKIWQYTKQQCNRFYFLCAPKQRVIFSSTLRKGCHYPVSHQQDTSSGEIADSAGLSLLKTLYSQRYCFCTQTEMLIIHSKHWRTMEKQIRKEGQDLPRCTAYMPCSWHRRGHRSAGGKCKREGQKFFFHGKVLYSAGIPHTLYNILRESTYTCSSKTSTSVRHGSQSIAWKRNMQSFWNSVTTMTTNHKTPKISASIGNLGRKS